MSDVADLSPEYCVGSIIPDLLQSESHEAQLIALKTLHLVVTSVPSGSPLALQQRASMPRRSMALTTGQGSCIKRMVQVRIVQVNIRDVATPLQGPPPGNDLAVVGVHNSQAQQLQVLWTCCIHAGLCTSCSSLSVDIAKGWHVVCQADQHDHQWRRLLIHP